MSQFAGNSGFRGIAVIDGTYMRFSSFDVNVKQDPNVFLPSYGGISLRTVFSMGTKDITATISGPLTEYKGTTLYNLAHSQSEFMTDIKYYGNQVRRLLGCKIDSLSFTVSAGDVINFSANIIAKESIMKNNLSLSYTKSEKIYTHDKGMVLFQDGTHERGVTSFTYTISNELKPIKTAESLGVNIIGNAVQNVSGQITFLNKDTLMVPETNGEYGLEFKNVSFIIGDFSVLHDIVIHPSENIQLSTGIVLSNINWTRADSFYP